MTNTAPAPACSALAEQLRAMRAHTGLSLAALAERTPYSKSSWERYLNGKLPVPRQAVEALCAMADEPPARLLALWELADAGWSGRARATRPAVPPPPTTQVPQGPQGPEDAGNPGSRPWQLRRRHLFTLGAGVVVVAAAVAALSVPGRPPERPALLVPQALDPNPGCTGTACDGKDPARMACGLPGRADALGPPHRTGTGARMEVRYSTVCAAGWGRVWHAQVGDAVEISAAGARPRRVVIRTVEDTGVYRFTPMVGGENHRTDLRLCFLPADGTARECYHP